MAVSCIVPIKQKNLPCVKRWEVLKIMGCYKIIEFTTVRTDIVF